MIITESELRRIIRQEILNESLSINSSEALLKENDNIQHDWKKIDDHLGFCKIYIDQTPELPPLPRPSKCLKIELDPKSDIYDSLLKNHLSIMSETGVIRMLDSCNLNAGEICIELLSDDSKVSLDSIITGILKFIRDQSGLSNLEA